MTDGSFQSLNVSPAALDGRIEARPVDPGAAQKDIVEAASPWRVDVNWQIEGFLVSLIGGTWHLQLAVDPIGVGTEQVYPVTPFAVPVTPNNGKYERQIAMQNVLAPGVYDVVVNLTYTDLANLPGPLRGYVELGRIVVQ